MIDLILTDEQKRLQRDVRALTNERLIPIAPEVDESEDVSLEVVKILAGANLFRWLTTREFGGPGDTVKAIPLCIIREELTRGCAQADTTFAMQGLGSYPILIAGTEAQKQKYIPPVISGDRLASLALTDPNSGSDVAGMTLTASRDGDDYLLNGEKKFTSNAPAAETYVVYGKTDPSRGAKGISAFIVEKGWPGFDLSHRLHLLAPHAICQPKFENCRVPHENLLGEENGGFRIAMQTLDLFRTTVGACAVGLARAALDEAVTFSKERRSFGQPISEFQAIKFKLADMATELEASRLLVYSAAAKKDAGAPRVTLEASMAKLFATEAAWRIVDQAVQIHGGRGVERGTLVEKLYREARAPRIYEGTSEIQRLVIGDLVLKG